MKEFRIEEEEDLHPHHSLAYVFVFSSQCMPIPLQPTFLHFLAYTFVVPQRILHYVPGYVNNFAQNSETDTSLCEVGPTSPMSDPRSSIPAIYTT